MWSLFLCMPYQLTHSHTMNECTCKIVVEALVPGVNSALEMRVLATALREITCVQ